MPVTNTPLDSTNSSNPWLLNKSNHLAMIGPEGLPLTAEYIWSKCGKDREDLVDWVFNYYRKVGFPYFKLTNDELKEEFKLLQNKDPNCVFENGVIKNSNTTGLDIAKHFTSELFYGAKGGSKNSKSCIEVFNNDNLFMKVLQNRMGYNYSTEDDSKRPYVFGMNNEMIIQGLRSSGLAYSVSHFKPLIASYIYKKYNVKKCLDYSAGWSSRCVSALSLGVQYFGIDPLTSDKVNNCIKYFDGKGFCVKEASELVDFNIFPDVDVCLSSPPYFSLEIYDGNEKQSSHYKTYEDWLKSYWKITVQKCYTKCKLFSFLAVEKVGKYNLLDDMNKVCIDLGGREIERIPIKTSTNHLSAKKSTKRVDKKTEHLIVYKVRN